MLARLPMQMLGGGARAFLFYTLRGASEEVDRLGRAAQRAAAADSPGFNFLRNFLFE